MFSLLHFGLTVQHIERVWILLVTQVPAVPTVKISIYVDEMSYLE